MTPRTRRRGGRRAATQPLRLVLVCLAGLVAHANNIVEHPELIAERLVQFAERVGRENVVASVDCGFSSQATYRTEVHPTVVWAKLAALVEGARLAPSRPTGRAARRAGRRPARRVLAPLEGALSALSVAMVILATALVVRRL